MKVSDYPFTQEAADAVRSQGITLESLLSKPLFQTVRSRAAERLRGAVGGSIPEVRASTEAEQLFELLSYPLARAMISCLNDDLLFRRYALAEAKLAFKRMQSEKDGLIALAEDLGIRPQGTGPWKIHFSEYIRAAHRMHSPKWKLTNRDLSDGYLTVTDTELMRILEEVVREKVLKGLPTPINEKICQSLEEYLRPVRRDMEQARAREKVDLGQVEGGAFPPCIKKMISDVEKGVNLAHSARFALVSFLLQINMTPDEVVDLFATSPDFDEDRTRYQVEHIAGATGTRYKPPACATMATYGNCPGEDDLCRRIRHPLSYYERRAKAIRPPSNASALKNASTKKEQP